MQVFRVERCAVSIKREAMILIQLRPEIDAQLAAGTQDHGLATGQAIDRIRELCKKNTSAA
jgi:hypothetical protein